MIGSFLLLCVLHLTGVTGQNMHARAFFDANNVKVGDPLVLTIDFLGEADFQSIHPPSLSSAVGKRDWKVDDVSAKTESYRDGRRLTYRVRPIHEGVLWFPALEFSYAGSDGTNRLVRTNTIPVHAKPGAQVVVAEMADAVDEGMPQPAPLTMDPGVPLDEDALFAWRKACANPSEQAFAAFDFPAAKMNQAREAILKGNWANALSIYRRVEWSLGQTPEIEQGIRAALALKYDNAHVELPVWRTVGRPVLKYGWKWRIGLVGGGLSAIALVFWLIGRGIQAMAVLAFALLLITPSSASAQDIFQQMQEQMRQMQQRMQQQMNQMSSGFQFSFGGEEQAPVDVKAHVLLEKDKIRVGDQFSFILTLEAPKTVSIGSIQITPSEEYGMTITGPVQNLADGTSSNPSNVLKRMEIPVRYDVPFKGMVSFRVQGMVSGRQDRGSMNNRFSLTFSNSFTCESDAVQVNILPLANAPENFSGIISEGLNLFEYPDSLRIETNDVVTITYRIQPRGYVPEGYLPKDAAYEWTRELNPDKSPRSIEYRRYFVADGAEKTPDCDICYYNPHTKTYKTAHVGGTKLIYVPSKE